MSVGEELIAQLDRLRSLGEVAEVTITEGEMLYLLDVVGATVLRVGPPKKDDQTFLSISVLHEGIVCEFTAERRNFPVDFIRRADLLA